ncbi:MAG: hypothetical protein AAGF79_16600 [Pseudomonadota bacterium]
MPHRWLQPLFYEPGHIFGSNEALSAFLMDLYEAFLFPNADLII